MKTISRNIYFYRLNAGFKNSGAPISVDLPMIFEHIDQIPFDNPKRYLPFDGRNICCWVVEKNYPIHIILGNIRTDTFPLLVNKGKFTPLDIVDGSEMAENIHIVIFEDYTLGFEYNTFGPRITSLADYINSKAHDVNKQIITMEPLIQRDQISRLVQLKTINSFTIRVKPGIVQVDRFMDLPILKVLEACQSGSGADSIEITFKASKKVGVYLSPDLLQSAVGIAKNIESDVMVEKLQLKGVNSNTLEEMSVNLLNTKFMSKKQILRLDSNCKAVDPNDAFQKIEQAYNDFGDEIGKACLVSYV